MTKRCNTGERAKISAAIVCESAGDVGARPFFRNCDFKIRITFVIFEANVVSGFVFFNKIVFEYYSFLLGIGDDKINIRNGRGKFSEFLGWRMRNEIRSHAIAQIVSFSNVDNGAFTIPKDIYTGFIR